jgi:hypothetical protein
LSLQNNFSFAGVDQLTLEHQVASVVAAGAEAVTTFCTNLQAAHYVEQWEHQFSVPVFDTVVTVVWDMLRAVGVDTRRVTGWGQLMKGPDMHIFDMVIRNARVVTAADIFYSDIGIRDGRITALGLQLPAGEKEIDAAGRYVTPGDR